jgi:MFS family permease
MELGFGIRRFIDKIRLGWGDRTEDAGGPMSASVRWRLAGMMALVYAVQGSFWPLLTVHLHDLGVSGRAIGWIFATYALACTLAPLGAGHVADRLLQTQRLLSLIYAVGSCLLVSVATGPTVRPDLLFAFFLGYWLITAPSYALANSLAFRNLPRPAEQFGSVRLFGTVGWMAVGWLVSGMLAWNGANRTGHGAYEAFWTAAVLSVCLAFYALALPKTAPLAAHDRRPFDFDEALELIKRPQIAIFLLCAFCVSLSTPFVYQTVPAYLQTLGMPRARIPMAMTLGQVLEIASLAVLPCLLRRFGQRGILTFGVTAWVVYYAILASHVGLPLTLLALPLNGVAIACFVVAGQMYLDREAPAHRRASAQGLHVMVTSGMGSFLGNLLAGELVSRNGGVGPTVFLVPCLINAGVVVLLVRAFRLERQEIDRAFVRPLQTRTAHAGAIGSAAVKCDPHA